MAFLHKNCNNFRDGLCTLYGVAVDPNGPACPSFTAKSMVPPQAAKAYPVAQQARQPPPFTYFRVNAHVRGRWRFRGLHRGGREFMWL